MGPVTNQDIVNLYAALSPRKATVVDAGVASVRVRFHADDSQTDTWFASVAATNIVGQQGFVVRVNREESVFVPIGIASGGGGGGGAVDSVNGQTGHAVLDADDISPTVARLWLTAAERTKLTNISGTNTGDQDLSGYATTGALSSGLAGKADTVHNHDADYADIAHDHAGVYSPASHNHDATYAALVHSHDQSDITGLATSLSGKANTTTLIGALPSGLGTNGQVLKMVSGTPAWSTDANTTYSEIPSAEITTGTASTARAISGRRAQDIVNKARDGVALASSLSPVATSGNYADLSGKPTLGTAAAQNSTAFATAAQGTLAGTAVQPGDLATVATSGDYDDLTGTPSIPAQFNPIAGANVALSGTYPNITFNASGGGGGGGAVDSVNTQTGHVVLDASDVGAATAAQGSLADSSIQPGDNITDLTNDAGYITSAPVTSVNGQTGAVNVDADDIDPTATRLWLTSAERTKLTNTSGTNTGDQTSVTGNAGTATALQTPRTINGVSFNGTANITIADATKVPTTRTVNGLALSGNITLNQGHVADTASYVRMTPAERTKLSDIATGAEVNVQPDWNAVSGDAFIANKPTLYTQAEVDALIASYKPKTKRGGTIGGSYNTAGDYPLTGGAGNIQFDGLVPGATYELDWSWTATIWSTSNSSLFAGVRITDDSGAAFHFHPIRFAAIPGGSPAYQVPITWAYAETVTANSSGEVWICPAVRWQAGTVTLTDTRIVATLTRA